MRLTRPLLGIAAALAFAVPASAQTPRADPADVESLDAIIAAVYDVISGPAGQGRDWDRFRSLFIPEARLIPSGVDPRGGFGYRVWSPEEYVATAGRSLERDGFYETEIGRVTERFGQVAHAFSAYQSFRTADDTEPFARGINSMQLFHDGERWWFVTIFWDSERPGNPVPEQYIGAPGEAPGENHDGHGER